MFARVVQCNVYDWLHLHYVTLLSVLYFELYVSQLCAPQLCAPVHQTITGAPDYNINIIYLLKEM